MSEETQSSEFAMDIGTNDNLLMVFKMPKKLPSAFCTQGGHSVSFTLVDWFRPHTEVGEPLPVDSLREFIKQKIYYNAWEQYLVVCRSGEVFLVDPTC